MEQRIDIMSASPAHSAMYTLQRPFLYKFNIGENEMSAKNKEIVEKVNASFAEGSVEGFLLNCADEVVWTMVGNKTTKGKRDSRMDGFNGYGAT